jgi:membrane protease YdiL (CAAX protease family)
MREDKNERLTRKESRMASLTRTLEGKLSTRTALTLSIAVILAQWVFKAIRNIYYIDAALARISSMQGFALSALKKSAFVVACVTLLLYLAREKYGDLGFHKRRLLRQIGLGALFGALIFGLDTFAIGPAVESLLPEAAPRGVDMSVFFSTWRYLPAWLAIVLLKGGLAEELWRIFGLTRFEKRFGKAGLAFALIAGSLVFGLGHTYQGLVAVITNALQGLLFAGIYLRKRSAWEPAVAHAVFDLIGITLGFLMYA